MGTGMTKLTAREEKLYREAICYLSQSGMTNDMGERNELLKEAAKRIGYIKRETQKETREDHGNPE